MLRRLTIQNVALIEKAELEFDGGLNVLSGETGAGKSVILDSIDFVLGAKADKSMIRYGKTECIVRAEFEDIGKEAEEALDSLDIATDDVLIISRKLTADGKSALKVNGCSVTATMLRSVSSRLVDVHGQSEHFYLLKESNQLKLLDSIAGDPVSKCKSELSALLEERKKTAAEISLIGGDESERNRRADILQFQIQEIDRTNLKEGEEEELTAFRTRCQNAERIADGISSARGNLLSDGGGIDAINTARRALNAISRYDEKYGVLAERLESVTADLSDVAAMVEEYGEELEFNAPELERAENRLDEIKSLKKKYGSTPEEIQTFLQKAQDEYAFLTEGEERLRRLTEQNRILSEKIYSVCTKLSDERKKAAREFTKRVTDELKTLNISSARFEMQFDGFTPESTAAVGTNGADKIRFLFSANAGEPVKELSKIISGGEMSRFMLAIKAQLSSLGDIGTYLFDEIDAGIGGKTARVMAEKFAKISKTIQIIAVTHSAQIAAFADSQFLIEKTEANESTKTEIKKIENEELTREISRLSGGEESEYSLKHAEEMLQNARIYKKSL